MKNTLAALVLWLGLCSGLNAAPIQWTLESGGNGHWYDLISAVNIFNPVDYNSTKSAAEAMSYQGEAGYLATITSQAENDFLISNFSILIGLGGTGTAFIGLNDANPDGNFRWNGGPESGQAPVFTNWLPGHPLPLANQSYFGALYATSDSNTNSNWISTSGSAFGYFVEFNDAPANPPTNGDVPEPSTIWLSAASFGLLACRSRRGYWPWPSE